MSGWQRYQQLEEIGHGNFGKVALGLDRLTGELVALKLIQRQKVAASSHAEAEILNHMVLRHPHVIALNEVFLTEEHLVMVMEYAPGGDLSSHIPPGGLPEREARWIFQQLIFSLEYCHRMGVASRDIKLENILIASGPGDSLPIIKLADFGLSTSTTGLERYEGAIGTPLYFSPEMLALSRGDSFDAKAADMWACGVVLYILLTGCCPFQRTSDNRLSRKDRLRVLFSRIQHVDYCLPKGLSPECTNLLAQLLAADPCQRVTAQQAMLHPWCAAGLQPQAMLLCNDEHLVRSKSNAAVPELTAEVQSIIKEASMLSSFGPETPPAISRAAHMLN